MKIAILAPPWFAVPPSGYGGIEWIVWLLADGLADQGHDVTLFASGDSHTKAKLEAVFGRAPRRRGRDGARSAAEAGREDAGAPRARVLRRVRRAAPRKRDRVPR